MARKDREPTAEELELDAEAWLESAEEHFNAGRDFYIAKFVVLSTDSSKFGGFASTDHEGEVARLLGVIESAGWDLFDVGYVFIPTEMRQGGALGTVVKGAGDVMGIYTFQRADAD